MPVPSQSSSVDHACNSPRESRVISAGDVVITSEPWVWSFQYQFHKRLCAQCFKESANLRACSNCKLYRFCNAECQTINWKKEHKYECAMLKKINEKLSKMGDRYDHDCHHTPCLPVFGCCTAEILMAKVINKIMREQKELPGNSEQSNALDIMQQLRSEPAHDGADADMDVRLLRLMCLEIPADPVLCDLLWPSNARKCLPGLDRMAKKIYYNAFPINEQRGKNYLQAVGIFPQALHRSMISVCWDMNVTMDMQGRTLVVRATENIPKYTGLKDLRQSEAFPNFVIALKERRKRFHMVCGHACGCRKCTPEYEAEITPLKCITSACPERIPSDQRALQPCPQCGALNGERLKKLQQIIVDYTNTEKTPADQVETCMRYADLLKELETENVVHSDAHFRFVSGFTLGVIIQEQGRFQEAFHLHRDMINCVRTLYPTYHLGRARYLVKAGAIPHVWAHRISKREKNRLKPFFDEALPIAVEWLLEAQGIYRKLGGEDSLWAQQIGMFIAKFGSTKVKSLGGDVNAPKSSFVNWDDIEMIFRW